MRHRCKVDHLGKPADQRKALIRSLLTSFFTHDEIMTTLVRAKALRKEADRIVTLAKRGPNDVHAIRQAAKLIYNSETGETWTDEKGREVPETVLHRIFHKVGPLCKERNGGYVRVVAAPPRRGDAADMAVVQLVDRAVHQH